MAAFVEPPSSSGPESTRDAPPAAPTGTATTPRPPATAAHRDGATLVIGVLLVLLGALLLFGQALGLAADWSRYGWPLFVVLPGVAFLAAGALGGPRWAGLAIPGSIVTTTGLVLLYQNTFEHFESWAYAWALVFPTALGLGLWLQGVWTEQPRLQEHGRNMTLLGVALFLVFAAFFEGVLNLSRIGAGRELVQYGLPAALIALGAYLLLRRAAERPRAP